jgi:hypothetical protein
LAVPSCPVSGVAFAALPAAGRDEVRVPLDALAALIRAAA